MLRFRRLRRLQKFVANHAPVHNHFNQERHLCSRANFKTKRATTLAEWRQLGAAKGQLHCPCGDWFALV